MNKQTEEQFLYSDHNGELPEWAKNKFFSGKAEALKTELQKTKNLTFCLRCSGRCQEKNI